ncbi:MAG: type VI secretion system tip protein VgrG [Rhodoferax sp.]|uniref:type VI secretion system Vgr family protein n=1 Tax=Rhodoferax sp. TaxID=50421 RepID=UPI0032644625
MSATDLFDSTPLGSLSALLGPGWSQNARLLRLHTPLGPDVLLAERLQAVEELFPGPQGWSGKDAGGQAMPVCATQLRLSCLSLDAQIDLDQLIGQPVLLQLQTDVDGSDGQPGLRPLHGHVTHAELAGANGGLARYHLTIEPWLAFLAYRRDSALYQDMAVPDILASIFGDYQGQGTLNPQWRLDLQDPAIYRPRSLTTQYQESDLAFISRLMAEEGLFAWIEHQGDPDSPSLGAHTLVIADHNQAFAPNPRAEVDFTQPGATMARDSIDRWRSQRRWHTQAVEISSWDYRGTHTRPISAHSSATTATTAPAQNALLLSRDHPGLYAYETPAQGQRIAECQLQALQARNKTFTGAGTVRSFGPASRFTLHGHAEHDQGSNEEERQFILLRVVHQAQNNLGAALQAAALQSLGSALDMGDAVGSEFSIKMAASADGTSASSYKKSSKVESQAGRTPDPASHAELPLYRNRFEAIRASIPYRAASTDGHGLRLHPKPTVWDQQSAIVVGPEGAVIHTDRDHRIQVQFHWQRGSQSHSRLEHPSDASNPTGHSGAPANAHSGTWVRLGASLAPSAGANWGSVAIPRIGQEVLIDFIEGDIDRPIATACVYNGIGQRNAAHNSQAQGAGVATGNAPAWFPGEQGDTHTGTDTENNTGHPTGNAHPAVLSGIKTQALSASQTGAGGYNQLVLDDTPGQSRTSLQHHAKAHQGTAELNLGQLRHQSDNQRLAPAGFGAELKTEHSAATRAGSGLLLSTDARAHASRTQMDSAEATSQARSSLQLQTQLADTAQKHNAKIKAQGKDEPEPGKLPALAQQQHNVDVLQASDNNATAYSDPLLQLSSPAGIAATTPESAIFSAGSTSSLSAGQDLNLAAQGNHHQLVKSGISLFTYGKTSVGSSKPNTETGIQLHAASGKLSSQSQSGQTRITADKTVTFASVTGGIQIAAQTHILLTAGGAGLRIEGGNITIQGPGTMAFKGSAVELAGPGTASASLALPKAGEIKGCAKALSDAASEQSATVNLG